MATEGKNFGKTGRKEATESASKTKAGVESQKKIAAREIIASIGNFLAATTDPASQGSAASTQNLKAGRQKAAIFSPI